MIGTRARKATARPAESLGRSRTQVACTGCPGERYARNITDAGGDRERELVAEAVFYALFRVVEIEELADAEKAVEWAQGIVDDPTLRLAFGDGVIGAVADRARRDAAAPGD
ncbi:MAG: hypothetical protein H0T69_07575 [Thermoleophilaceae bacterium]|nr:hypothetical protein [Thermoleophilaceae bacterium]